MDSEWSTNDRRGRPHGVNLPATITSFVGRRTELGEIGRILCQSRLVTLIGVGGVGKTRLAIEAANQFSSKFPDGVWFIELAALRDPALLPHTIESSMGIAERSARHPTATLAKFLKDRTALMILDNCEHLVEQVAEFAHELLREARQLRILATSRHRVGVVGETIIQVLPLDVADSRSSLFATKALEYPALQLFADRAAAVVPDFKIDASNLDTVHRLCQRLEGIPLALELAAVRLRILHVSDLADRLTNRFSLLTEGGRTAPARHRTLQATIDWSYELCTPTEQLLWARMSIFTASFSLEAAQTICSDTDLAPEEVLEPLSGLVDKSIVIAEQSGTDIRFRLLETIREYGAMRLRDAGFVEELRIRHRDWYLAFIDDACDEWFGAHQKSWCDKLRLELPNIRAALEFSVGSTREVRAGLHLVGRPWFLWVCLFLAEGRHWLDLALAAPSSPCTERTQALATAAYVASLQGDRQSAELVLEQCRSAGLTDSDHLTSAYIEHVHGVYLLFFGESERCRDRLRSTLRLYGDVPAPNDLPAIAQIQLGLSLVFCGDITEAATQFEECRARCEAAGERWIFSYALYGLALASFAARRFDSALESARLSLDVKRNFGDTLGLAMTLDLIAWIETAQGVTEHATIVLGAAARLWRTFGAELFGSRHWLAYRYNCETRARAALGERYDDTYSIGVGLSLEDAIERAMASGGSLGGQEETTSSGRSLTPREWEVAHLISQGLPNKAIASRLHMGQRTAETHVQHILNKLGFSSRAQIANWIGERTHDSASETREGRLSRP